MEFSSEMSFLKERDVPAWLLGSGVTQESATRPAGSCAWCTAGLICLSRCSHSLVVGKPAHWITSRLVGRALPFWGWLRPQTVVPGMCFAFLQPGLSESSQGLASEDSHPPGKILHRGFRCDRRQRELLGEINSSYRINCYEIEFDSPLFPCRAVFGQMPCFVCWNTKS